MGNSRNNALYVSYNTNSMESGMRYIHMVECHLPMVLQLLCNLYYVSLYAEFALVDFTITIQHLTLKHRATIYTVHKEITDTLPVVAVSVILARAPKICK